MNALRRLVKFGVVFAIPVIGLLSCSQSPTNSQPSTATQKGQLSADPPAASSVSASKFDEQHVRELVHSQLALLLSRPSFSVLRWQDEKAHRVEAPNYWVMTGRVTFVNVFQEESTHEYAGWILPPDELVRLSIDGENIWAKPFENLSQAAQATITSREYDIAYSSFSAQFEAKARPAVLIPGEETAGRTWTDRTGRYAIRGTLLGRTPSGLVRLEKATGGVIDVAESELSADNRAWIAKNEAPQPVSKD